MTPKINAELADGRVVTKNKLPQNKKCTSRRHHALYITELIWQQVIHGGY